MENVIELREINKIYHTGEVSLHVLNNINLKIRHGEHISIMGASGSGKSTLLNMIGCLDRPTSGKIIIDGKDASKLNDNELAHIREKKIGFVFQFFYLIPNLDVLQNVELPMIFANRKDLKKRALELLKMVGLEKRLHHYPSQLSGGEQQRVAIARALANEPEIILADEPTGNLDSKSGKAIMDILYKLNKDGITLLIVTHENFIGGKAKRRIYLKDGQIIRGA